MRIVGQILLKIFIRKFQVMDVLFEETDKPVGLLEEHIHHMQFLDEKSKAKQSTASPSPWRARPSPAMSWRKKCNSMQFSHEIAGEGHALRGDRLALLCFFSSGNCRWWTCSSRRPTGFANERPGSDRVNWGPMRGLKKNFMKRDISKDWRTLRLYDRIG